MNKLITMTSAVALALSTVAVSAADVAQAPTYAPHVPFAMGVADQDRQAELHKAFIERQTAAHKQVMDVQRQMADQLGANQKKLAAEHKAFADQQAAAFKQAMEVRQKFAEQFAAEQTRMMEEQNRTMEAFFQEQAKLNEQYSASAPAPFTMPEMPEMPAPHAFPEMPEMPAPTAFGEMPEPPAFEEFANMDPEARRTAMAEYSDELREAMQQRRDEMRKQMDERRAQARQEMQERRDSIAKERVRYMGRDV